MSPQCSGIDPGVIISIIIKHSKQSHNKVSDNLLLRGNPTNHHTQSNPHTRTAYPTITMNASTFISAIVVALASFAAAAPVPDTEAPNAPVSIQSHV